MQMEAAQLAEAVARTLAPVLPYLLGLAEKVVDGAAEKLGEGGLEKVRELWGRLRGAGPAGEAVARRGRALAEAPADERAHGRLEAALEVLLDGDGELKSWVGKEIAALPDLSVVQQAMVHGGGTAVVGPGIGAGQGGLAGGEIEVHGDLRIVNLYLGASPISPQTLLQALGVPAPSVDLRAATAAYLEHLVERFQYLDFRGLGMSDRVALRLPLAEMYVPLRGEAALPEGEKRGAGQRERSRGDEDVDSRKRRERLRVAGRRLSPEELVEVGRTAGPQPLLDLVKANEGLVILGDPGAGKSTFLKYLALSLATGKGGDLGLRTRLPVLVPLSAYANALASGDVALDAFVPKYFADLGIKLPVGALIEAALARGGVLFLLDGLDEVREEADRSLVSTRVAEFFKAHRKAGNRFLLTSRIVGYREVRPSAEGLGEATLVDFDDGEIEAFVDRWTGAVERAARGTGEAVAWLAEREREELLAATRDNPGVRRLATNPLLLTILALMKRQGVALPERRVELYEHCLRTLLRQWALARGLDGRPPAGLLDVDETVKVLAPLALWMHETSPGIGLVKEGDLWRETARLLAERAVPLGAPDDFAGPAKSFLADVRAHSSLLVDRGGKQFGFLHLTFQEYLAAVAIGRRAQKGVGPVVEALADRLADPAWREVALLAIGYVGVVTQQDEVAARILDELLRLRPGEPGAAEVFAGEAAADVAPGGLTAASRERVVAALLATMRDDARVPARTRAAAGVALARVGDPRPEVTTVDGMEFCWVPAGPFWMGSGTEDREADSDERPAGKVELPYGYWVGRFPVTVAQWREYVEASRIAPGDRDSLRGAANAPVVWVSWDEAMAFCGWATERWRSAGFLGEGWKVSLPSEAEWEKAARGGLEVPAEVAVRTVREELGSEKEAELRPNPEPRRRYPWGDAYEPEKASTSDTGLWSLSTVGCFPGGLSVCGAEEMSGNAWEWTRNSEGDYPYPAPGGKRLERETPAGDSPRVLRGGSFVVAPGGARCAYRGGDLPDLRLVYIGFRVVVLPPFSDL